MSKSDMAVDDMKWKTEQDLRSLVEAAEINKDPKRLAAVKKLAKEKAAELAKI